MKFKNPIIFIFLFLIPYVLLITMIAISYNALTDTPLLWYKLAPSIIVATVFVQLVFKIYNKPVKTLLTQAQRPFLRKILTFFVLDTRTKQVASVLINLVVITVSTTIIAKDFNYNSLTESTIGWLLMFATVSSVIGAIILKPKKSA